MDAGTVPNVSVAATRSAETIVGRIARLSLFRARFDAALVGDGGGLEVSLPARASDPVRLVAHDHEGVSIDLSPVGANPARFELARGARVHVDAFPSTDLVRVSNGALGDYEEILVFRDANAPTTLRWSIAAGPGIAGVRVREGHVELVDANGRVDLASAPMLAVDANGVVRPLSVALESSEDGRETIVARIDTAGLAYPITVDPSWAAAATLATPRSAAGLVALSNGRALVVGGIAVATNAPTTSAEIYDLASNTWRTVASMKNARSSPGVVWLSAAGKIVVAGGKDASSTATTFVERYDLATDTWSNGVAMDKARTEMIFTPLAGGARTLLVDDTTQSEVYDPAADAWTITGAIPSTHGIGSQATVLGNGNVMLTGGGIFLNSSTSGAWIFTPSGSSGSWAAVASMSHGRDSHASMLVAGRYVVVGGGGHWGPTQSGFTRYNDNTVEYYDTTSGTWTNGPLLAKAGPAYGAALANGNAYFFESGTAEFFVPGAPLFTNAGPTSGGPASGAALSTGTDVLFLVNDGTSNVVFELAHLGQPCLVGTDCGSGLCAAGACCTVASCPAGFVCNAPDNPGKCEKVQGAACTASSQCDTGHCVDGVCCDTACGGQCQACDVPGETGTCSPIVGVPHGTRAACPGAGSADPCQVEACDGSDVNACHFPGGGVPCGTAACAAGVETHVSVCNGAGGCLDTSKSCGSYTCGATACKTTCGSPPDCASGYYCDTTHAKCVPLTGLGRACDASTPCTAGLFCTDGVCCGKQSCGAGSSCALPGHAGECLKTDGVACGGPDECGSANCVDGVCCDTACTGQCEACNVKGAVGTCSPVVGVPHGTRAPCASDATNVCAGALCDGADRTKCAAFVGGPSGEVECRPASCASGSATERAVCDGMGACPAAITVSCDGYACDPTFQACKTACTSDQDCVSGYACVAEKCTQKTDACARDFASVIKVDGSSVACAPFVCRGGSCLTTCTTSTDCAAGLACNADTKTCDASSGGSGSGGCAIASASTGEGDREAPTLPLALGGLAFAIGLLRRRSRRSDEGC